MKSILKLSIAALVAVMFSTGCETDPNSSVGAPDIRPMAAGGGGSDPDPAIAYGTSVTSKGKTYRGIAVMDSTGSNQTVIYKASPTDDWVGQPTWNPAGTSLAYLTKIPGDPWTIHLIDVSVSRGKATGSNRSTLTTTSNTIRSLSWSSLSSTNKIAFTTQVQTTGTGQVQVISASSGTPTVLYETESANGQHFYYSVTWSPDDSKIAFVDRAHATGEDTIRVINASTGALLEVIPLGATNWTYIDWSNAGANLLAMGLNDKLYYVTPTSGSTPWTNNVSGNHPTWSPTNSAVVTGQHNVLMSSLQKIMYGTSTTSSLGGTCYMPDWK